MDNKHAKKFLFGIWVVIIGMLTGFFLAKYVEQRKAKEYEINYGTLTESTEQNLVDTYTTEEVKEWNKEINSARIDNYKSYMYNYPLSNSDLSQVDESLYEFVDYDETGDNTEVLAQVVYALSQNFGNEISSYKFIDMKYDDAIMQGVYVITSENTEYDVVISEDDSQIYVNVNAISSQVLTMKLAQKIQRILY